MINQGTSSKIKFDLEERTLRLGENIIKFIRKIEVRTINENIVKQLLKSATSIGANYIEATAAESRKDFIHKVGIAKKEAKETTYWLRLLATTEEGHKDECRLFWKEAHELTLIFATTVKTARSKIV